ncbi:hypothetical protein J3R83DRAFT_4295 [Lanmaoa asiatica]|nr:hypothetical protein J3R83DRAFT_4295 [Lanmaoa asiatica]
MTEPSGVHLTTSRVNRLLRPLRNKCNSLAALPKAATASRVTYSKQSSNWDPESRPPLTVLCSSAGTKKLALDRHSADEFELSRRIHAVCDAFKNIAHVAYGQPRSERILSLAAMCTLVVGENMPAANSDSTSVDSGEDSTEENDVLDVDGIYEAVPPHYRRFLIVSHALSMILCICTHHHTLVTILFDHCLSFSLVHESTHLLNIILAQAFLSSNSSYPPPITHPTHANYLLDLHAKWTTGNKPSGTSPGSLLFTTSAFCQAVLDTLSQTSSYNSRILWTSKVLNKLLHTVESCDIDSYILIIRTLSRSFWEISGSSLDSIRDEAHLVVLRNKLSELMSNLLDLLFAQCDSHSSLLTPSRIYAAIDILYDCRAARLHCLRMPTPGCPIDLQDIVITLTAHILVAFRNSINNSDHLVAILDDSSPVPTTFSKLMVYFSRLQESQAFEDFVEAFLAELKMYSSAFRSEKLFGLDASLWACALHHFDTSIASSEKASSTLVTRYKRQLMEAVDAAERRCFGGDVDSSPVVSSIRSNRAKRTRRGRLSGHWEWEDMVGSWIRKTPVHKKQKVTDGLIHGHGVAQPPRLCLDQYPVSTPLSTYYRRSSTFSPSSSYSRLSEPESRTEDGSEYQEESDKENYPRNPPASSQGIPSNQTSKFKFLFSISRRPDEPYCTALKTAIRTETTIFCHIREVRATALLARVPACPAQAGTEGNLQRSVAGDFTPFRRFIGFVCLCVVVTSQVLK